MLSYMVRLVPFGTLSRIPLTHYSIDPAEMGCKKFSKCKAQLRLAEDCEDLIGACITVKFHPAALPPPQKQSISLSPSPSLSVATSDIRFFHCLHSLLIIACVHCLFSSLSAPLRGIRHSTKALKLAQPL